MRELDPLNVMKHFQSEDQWVIGPHGHFRLSISTQLPFDIGSEIRPFPGDMIMWRVRGRFHWRVSPGDRPALSNGVRSASGSDSVDRTRSGG